MGQIEFLKVPTTQDFLADLQFWRAKVAEVTGVSQAMMGEPLRTGMDWGRQPSAMATAKTQVPTIRSTSAT